MIGQGLILMAAGMGTVAVFLILLVLAMQAAGAYFKANEASFREAVPEAPARRPAAGDETDVIAAVLAAVTAYKRK